jgi:cell shape-determining protein MreC
MTVGRALLTNPIFLLAAAIIAIVAVVILIMDKLGLLKKIMDALGWAVNLVVKAFEALTDWLGLTTNSQEDAAEAAKKNGEEQRKQIEKTATAQKNLAKLTEGLTQEEVDALRKKAGIKDALNQNSFDIEKTRLQQTQLTLAEEINALVDLRAAGGELTEEQEKELEQRLTDYDANAAAIEQIEYNKVQYIQNLNRNLTDTLEGWKIKNMTNVIFSKHITPGGHLLFINFAI